MGFSEQEANHFGRFLCSALETVRGWYKDAQLFEKVIGIIYISNLGCFWVEIDFHSEFDLIKLTSVLPHLLFNAGMCDTSRFPDPIQECRCSELQSI